MKLDKGQRTRLGKHQMQKRHETGYSCKTSMYDDAEQNHSIDQKNRKKNTAVFIHMKGKNAYA
jgi:hypothetical protein